MIRLAIVVEGTTEKEFVDRILAGHLASHDIMASARRIGTRGHQGGNVTVQRIARDVRNLIPNFDAVTTLVDFYGFRRPPTDDIDELQLHIDRACRDAVRQPLRDDRVFAYVQRHEFEALLFSEPRAFARLLAAPTGTARALEAARASFGTPEDIDSGPETAPSKRIVQVYPGYDKVLHGILVAAEVGLEAMRRECPRFADWLSRLERLTEQVP